MPQANHPKKPAVGLPTEGRDYTAKTDPGPYIGIVKGYGDDTGMNRIAVYIPALAQQRKSKESGYDKTEYESNTILCSLALPFYGRTNALADNSGMYEMTTKSYGMTFPTPDIDTQVMVVFAEGKLGSGYIISYIPDALMLHMVPGIAASPAFKGSGSTKAAGITSPKFEVPVAEYNKLSTKEFDKTTAWKNVERPVHPMFDTLLMQGLETDYVRGLTTSSVQRESPSNVFGISTPGPLDYDFGTITQGLVTEENKEGYDWPYNRKSGHSFVMDDGDSNGNSQLIRLRTGTGHQILLSDDGGTVYLGTASGSAWAELRNDGSVDVFSAKDVSVHAEGNVNMLADVDVNIQAGEDINLLAGHNFKIETNPTNAQGKGHAHFYINGNLKATSVGTMNFKSTDWFNITCKEAISVTSTACIFLKSGGGAKYPIKLNTEAGNVADEASRVAIYENNWINKGASNTHGGKRYAVDGSYSYYTAMQRVPMHEPDPRINQSKKKEPKAGTTSHIADSSN
jgi:hypothetical protein